MLQRVNIFRFHKMFSTFETNERCLSDYWRRFESMGNGLHFNEADKFR